MGVLTKRHRPLGRLVLHHPLPGLRKIKNAWPKAPGGATRPERRRRNGAYLNRPRTGTTGKSDRENRDKTSGLRFSLGPGGLVRAGGGELFEQASAGACWRCERGIRAATTPPQTTDPLGA